MLDSKDAKTARTWLPALVGLVSHEGRDSSESRIMEPCEQQHIEVGAGYYEKPRNVSQLGALNQTPPCIKGGFDTFKCQCVINR